MNALFNILKPPGMTSSDVVVRLRRMTGIKRVGHGGTLDPQAAGVLPVCVGKATRLFPYLQDHTKRYLAEITFGVSTDTQDAWGSVLESGTVPPDISERLKGLLPRFTGELAQVPPMYSAIKLKGKKLYELARAGVEVAREPRRITIHSLEIAGKTGENRFLLDVSCSKGTYVRTLCHDLGREAGCGAHMSFLLRTAVGPFELEEAVTLEELEEAREKGTLMDYAYPLEGALSHLPQCQITEEQRARLMNGVRVEIPELPESEPVSVWCEGTLVCIGKAVREEDALCLKSAAMIYSLGSADENL